MSTPLVGQGTDRDHPPGRGCGICEMEISLWSSQALCFLFVFVVIGDASIPKDDRSNVDYLLAGPNVSLWRAGRT